MTRLSAPAEPRRTTTKARQPRVSEQEWLKRAESHVAQTRELLDHALLGKLCDYGEAEVLSSLHRATVMYSEWRKECRPEPSTFVQILAHIHATKATEAK